MEDQHDPIGRAIKNLWQRRVFRHSDKDIVVACLIREADWRPLEARWWRGKEVCIIGADLSGNFLLRHCDGSVGYWDHRSRTDIVLAPSVRAFVAGLSDNEPRLNDAARQSLPKRKTHWPIVNPSAPDIARKARRYEMKLGKALAIAARRDSSNDPRMAELYATAKVEGVDSTLRTKQATVTFSTTPFRGGYHQIYDWTNVEESTVLELAESIGWSLRRALRWSDKRKKATKSSRRR
jgi:hypothetical protein